MVPKELVKARWIKCMNSPIWIRKNISNQKLKPGLPYQDPVKFGKWLEKNIGNPKKVTPILFGLTLDCCVLSTLQELNWRDYYPKVLYEAVDHYLATQKLKDEVIESSITNWADIIYWKDLKSKI